MSVALVFFTALAATLPDRGIYPEFDSQISITLPASISAERVWLRADPARGLVTLYDGDDPLKVYRAAMPRTLAGDTIARAGGLAKGNLDTAPATGIVVSETDFAELSPLVPPAARLTVRPPARAEDHDGDGLVDRLDILLGARKLTHNKARYIERYVTIKYPGGDVPRTEGVCSDTVIRALRNAGIDLQKEVHEDILRARAAYPMVEKVDASINHRRVRTIVRWFERHFTALPKGTPYRPGDIVFLDTFPSKTGPDHLGVVADTAKDGVPLVINNWTDGTVDAEMELLSWVPVTHHFRAR